MRRSILYIMAYIVTSSLFISGCRTHDYAPELVKSPIAESIHSGDLVFRRGSSAVSLFVSANDAKGIYTHIGIIEVHNGINMVLHSVPGEAPQGCKDRIKKETLDEFFKGSKATRGAIYRVKGVDSLSLKQLTLDANRLYLKGVEFDDSFDITDSTKLYCTEYIKYVFNHVGYDITAGNYTEINNFAYKGQYIFPSDIISNKDLQLIFSF